MPEGYTTQSISVSLYARVTPVCISAVWGKLSGGGIKEYATWNQRGGFESQFFLKVESRGLTLFSYL